MNEHVSTVVGPQATNKPDTREMVAVHRAFRREFRQGADLVQQAPAGDLRRATQIADHLELVVSVLHHHHSAEDEHVWPLLLKRAAMRAALVHRMETQHEDMAQHLEKVQMLLAQWRSTAASSVATELSSTLRQLNKALVEHLDDEESSILPIVEECMTVAEWAKVGEAAVEGTPISQRFTVFGLLLEEATPAEAELLFGTMPAIARIIWKVSAKRAAARYIRRVRADALL
ncbi:MAG TPA: hemerythrin domain-containing protein [Pseudonocardiaceae bacterium]